MNSQTTEPTTSLMELARVYAHAYYNHHTGSPDGMLERSKAVLQERLSAALEHAQRVAPRMLSWKEIEAVAETDEITGDGICVFGEELLRKFCEVNGITSDAATPSAGEAEPRMAFCPACFVEVSAKEADQQTLDARRYRWLRDQWDRGTLEAVMLSKSSDGTSWVGGEVLDGRIDAAIKKHASGVAVTSQPQEKKRG